MKPRNLKINGFKKLDVIETDGNVQILIVRGLMTSEPCGLETRKATELRIVEPHTGEEFSAVEVCAFVEHDPVEQS